MKDFHLDRLLSPAYSRYPEAWKKPLIGLTANFVDGNDTLAAVYCRQIADAGGTPVIIPPIADTDTIINTLNRIDGLILTGGGDLNPLWSGEQPSPALRSVNAQRDAAELLTVRLAFNRQLPVLGICRGMQVLATALGGSVAQDISARPGILKHNQDADRGEPTHSVTVTPDTTLAQALSHGSKPDSDATAVDATPLTFCVNSFHHQAVDKPGPRFRTAATAPDGTIEAIESVDGKPVIGVQWHPEWLADDGKPLFAWLVDEARDFAWSKQCHDSIITLDSHCDTPMFFPLGVDFSQRDPRVRYDLHKMEEGRLDAVVMAAYLPQPAPGEPFASNVDTAAILSHMPEAADVRLTAQALDNISPCDYADLILNRIMQIVKPLAYYVLPARTAADVRRNKRKGHKSLLLAIENGIALEHDLRNVGHFARRGVVYITLCHNGDNDICDSARGTGTHGGLSDFGRDVIHEMNRYGMLVDLSHAAETSFYDAIDASDAPVVCSHACCRALCDNPRNLTDDQMRTLARQGGVMQITLYHGFLRSDRPATIDDVADHILHAIEVMGIRHVGIGTDFDGDGGVAGLADASELTRLTTLLHRRGLHKNELMRIWGNNWLDAMTAAQTVASN